MKEIPSGGKTDLKYSSERALEVVFTLKVVRSKGNWTECKELYSEQLWLWLDTSEGDDMTYVLDFGNSCIAWRVKYCANWKSGN